jgi:hypothetical protein
MKWLLLLLHLLLPPPLVVVVAQAILAQIRSNQLEEFASRNLGSNLGNSHTLTIWRLTATLVVVPHR